ncbi:MAG: hypothetical protein ACRD0I_08475 [Acidimicrobiales bacterium]
MVISFQSPDVLAPDVLAPDTVVPNILAPMLLRLVLGPIPDPPVLSSCLLFSTPVQL